MIRVKLSEDDGIKLKNFRCNSWLTDYAIARTLNVSRETLVNYEKAVFNIPLEFLGKLAELYGADEIKNFGVKVERGFVKKQASKPSFSKNMEYKKFLNEEKEKMIEKIRSLPEACELSKMRKPPFRTKQTDELNFYIPEKWVRQYETARFREYDKHL